VSADDLLYLASARCNFGSFMSGAMGTAWPEPFVFLAKGTERSVPFENFTTSRRLNRQDASKRALRRSGFAVPRHPTGDEPAGRVPLLRRSNAYLNLVRENLADSGIRVLAYSLMTNHVHWLVVPDRADSLAILFLRVHGRYAQAFNARRQRSGHL
jgi:hypothetical protein